MEDDARFEDGDVDHVGAGDGRCGTVAVAVAGGLHAGGLRFGFVPLDEPVAGVLDEEGQKEAGHEDGRGGALVRQLAEALVGEHEGGMGVELDWLAPGAGNPHRATHMNKRRRDDDTSAELPEDGEDGVGW